MYSEFHEQHANGGLPAAGSEGTQEIDVYSEGWQFWDIFQEPQTMVNHFDSVESPALQMGSGSRSNWNVLPDVESSNVESPVMFPETDYSRDGTALTSPGTMSWPDAIPREEGKIETNMATMSEHSGGKAFTSREPSSESVLPSKRVAGETLSKTLRKRRRESRENEDKGSNDDDSRAVTSRGDDTPCFACPFYRRDPQTYQECMHHTLTRIRDVKQHIRRRHTPASSCPTCYMIFSSIEEGENHIRARDCQPRDPSSLDCVHGISTKVQEELQHRMNRKKTAQEQWYEVWGILFKGVPEPSQPYLGTVFQETLGMMRDFWKQEGGQAGTDFLQSHGASFDGVYNMETLFVELFDHLRALF
ncbi:hypothetical protein S40288_08309 [Stachybotrys chartarum IBT 40288]|nr:hypothetical protein S40288_08309 [Stachybotrys chartarum IBT 40288]